LAARRTLPLDAVKLAFVTGGTGFVGANVIRELLARGWRVRALARAGSDRRNLDGLDLDIVVGDLDSPHLARSLEGCDALFHIAAHYSLFRKDRDAVMHANAVGTRTLLAAAGNARVPRTVYTSSVSAIGVKSGAIADETYQSAPERLIGAYKRSKYLAEREALAAAERGLDVTIVNPSTPIGPWDRKPTPTGEILVRLLTGNMPAIVDTGLNFVAVEDVARGHLAAYERGKTGERYILGDENLTLRAFLARAAAIARVRAPRFAVPHWLPLAAAWIDESASPLFGRAPSLAVDSVRMSREAMYYDARKARAELGYATTGLDGAIERAVAWFVQNGYARTPLAR
jgi:dihydroflavonol-4-reductase